MSGRGLAQAAAAMAFALSLLPAAAWGQASPFTTGYRYDGERRVTGTIAPDPDGPGGNGAPAVRNSYDPAGRLVKVEEGALAAWQSEGVAPADWTGFSVHRVVDTAYDALDRKTREAASGGGIATGVTEYGYDVRGRLRCTAVRMNPDVWASPLPDQCEPGTAHAVHGPDRISKTVYDPAGQPIESWDGVGTPLARREAAWTYDGNGRRTSLTDARGYRAEMRYDGFGRQSCWIFPSTTAVGAPGGDCVAGTGDYESYGYDANDNRTSLRKRDGSVLAYRYDALNRVTSKLVPERAGLAAAHTRDVFYAYDLRGLQTKARFDNLDGEGITNYYDGFGQLALTVSTMGGHYRPLSHLHDLDGNRVRLTHADNVELGYSYDALGRMTLIHDHAGLGHVDDHVVRYWYHPTGTRFLALRGAGASGFVAAYYYDAALRPSAIVNDLPFPGADMSIDLAYNPAGQIVRLERSNVAYAWTGSAALSRDHETDGQNRYLRTSSGGVQTAAFAYDANGNLTGETTASYNRSFVYDVENRLVGAAGGGSDLQLLYDPVGRLFQVSDSQAGVTQFLYDGDEMVAEYDGSGTLLKRYVHGPGTDEPVAVYEGASLGLSNRRYMLPDERGSIASLVNADGSPSVINTYDEYGIPGRGNAGRFQYTGQAWIGELGLYHYKARLYSPKLGRFLQVDPIGYDDQVNLYAYVGNDPVNNADPTGEWISIVLRGLQWAAQRCIGNASCRGAAQSAGQTVKRGVDRITGRGSPGPSRRQPSNPHGSKGKPDHQREVARQQRIAEREVGPGETVLRERKARGMDVDRRPDVQTRDRSGDVVRVREVERHPDSKRVQDKLDDYERNGIRCDVVDCMGNPR